MENTVSRYYTLNQYLRETFGCKVYKLALDGGMTCPNRDGTRVFNSFIMKKMLTGLIEPIFFCQKNCLIL